MLKTRAFQYAVAGGILGIALSMFAYYLLTETSVSGGVVLFLPISLILILSGAFLGKRYDMSIAANKSMREGVQEAEDHLGKIARAAVMGGNLEVDIDDVHIPTCWEMKNCIAAECPVFRKKNIRCWFIAGTYCEGTVQGTFAQKLGDCSRCEVYIAAIENHPVGMIRENFNNLLWVVNEKTRLLATANSELHEKYGELQKLQAETLLMAETDVQTGLHNYNHFNEYLKREVANAKRYGKVMSLMMMDFNNFKTLNEQHGYQKGDLVLSALAENLRQHARSNDYLARYGNEEFVMVLSGVDGEKAVELAEKMSKHLGRVATEVGVDKADLEVSIGIADFPDCAHDNRSLIAAADTALLFAKKSLKGISYFCDIAEADMTADDVQRLQNRLQGAGMTTLAALARAVDAADNYVDGDRKVLTDLAEGMARQLGMDKDESEMLVLAASIHDIGKIGVPADVLNKTDKLSPHEVDMVKKHPEIGQDILREARQIQELVLAILYHHERWDGKGYPEGLEGDSIPRMARIVGIFDSYRAMRCDRPYRKAMSRQQAVTELRKGAGSQFDPELVEIFIDQLDDHGGRNLKEVI
jgi:diguanylate cyclase (GGDEF)-like protein